jgi:hypothetical protein
MYVRLTTYASADGTGSEREFASVVGFINNAVAINVEVPPILYFCSALVITGDCDIIDNTNFIDYDTLQPDETDYGQSMFQAATNAAGGYVVTSNGLTMTSGIKSISALSVPTLSLTGEPQFGINLRDNSNPDIGADMTGVGNGQVSGDYALSDLFKFEDSDVIAFSPSPTLFNSYTVSYIVNVPEDQEGGIYNTTVTFYCTAAF